jgi:hypothetical protein
MPPGKSTSTSARIVRRAGSISAPLVTAGISATPSWDGPIGTMFHV